MGKEITTPEEMHRYLRRLGYTKEGQEARLPVLAAALLEAAGGTYPFLIHQVRDGTLPLGEKPVYEPCLSWFLVTGAKGHQQVHCEDVLHTSRRIETGGTDTHGE